MKKTTTLILVAFIFLLFSGCKDEVNSPIIVDESPEVNAKVYIDPVPFRYNNKYILAYELHVVNNKNDTLIIKQVQVQSNSNNSPQFPIFEGETLTGMMGNIKQNVYAIGQMIFFWLEFDNRSQIPSQIIHRIKYLNPIDNQEVTIESEVLNISRTDAIEISSPVKGKNWVAVNGPANNDYHHRRFVIDINGAPYMGQRFGIDWIRIGDNGLFFKDNTNLSDIKNDDLHCYGDTLYAVANGYIIDCKDGMPENPVGSLIPGITLETAGGNCVILQINDKAFAFYAHLIPGTLLVNTGDYVREGQPIGLLGNSGNSDMPHLHFHMANNNSFFFSQGIPYEIKSYEKSGEMANVFEWMDTLQPWIGSGATESINSQLPANNTILDF